MAIDLPEGEAVTIAPQPAIVATKLWMTQLVIRTPGPADPNSLLLEYQPWAGGVEAPIRRNGGADTTKSIIIEDVFGVAEKVPEMAVAMQAILQAIPALLQYVNAQRD